MQSLGLGAFQPTSSTIREPPQQDRIAGQNTAELITLRRVAQEVRQIADDLDPDEPEQKPDDGGDFDANLAETLPFDVLARIANDLLQGIESDLQSRKQWEKITEKAIQFLGLIYEEASGEVSAEGSISKVWHTLMLEATLQFWANAYAEFLPADGPVKVRDDKPIPLGHNGGPPLDDDGDGERDTRAENLETDMNHYLTVGDRQYYRDFSRMLMSLGPIGTQFRKVYYNPLRKMAVSEWVKAENLIVSNDAVHLATAGRVTERIMMSQADVKRLQLMGWWIRQPMTTPVDSPTAIEQTIGQVEGIRPGSNLPYDYRHTTYECYSELDIPGFEHKDEDGEPTGLPLPYRVSIDKDSRRIHEIRRNWKKEDDEFNARPHYVMFGLIPGFGFYYLGYAHILGNTERALTALEREIIDAGMYSIFPGFVHGRGALKDTTQVRPPPGGSVEVNLQMKQSVNDVLQPIPYKDLPQSIMNLMQGLEGNGRKLVSVMEIPVGEGTANIPVGTMISMIEESTKLTAAVHKGLHASRTEELELLKELIAEDPTLLTRFNKSPARDWQEAEEFADLDLVPASDPNTPSHIHRIMRAVALGQVSQMFPDRINRDKVLEKILETIRIDDPQSYILPPAPAGTPQPSPAEISAQTKLQTTTIQAQSRAQETAAKLQGDAEDRQSKERVAALGEQTERLKDQTQVITDQAKMHDSVAERAQDAQLAREQQGHERQLEHDKAMFPYTTPPRAF